MNIIEIQNFNFKYPNTDREILKNIDLDIKKGDFVTICGKSGSGKTTLIRHLKPQISPFGDKKGSILCFGKNINEISEREKAEKIGFVFQDPDTQIVTDKVWHELAFSLENFGYKSEDIRIKVAEMASFFGINSWFHKNTNELSGGQKQKLNLASVLITKPEILILDEPTAQLDPISAVDFLDTLKKINKELGITVIITEHRLEEVFPLSDKVVLIENGQLKCCDTPEKVCEFIINTNNEMIKAIPSPSIICGEIANKYPLDIKEGRTIIENFFNNKEHKFNKIEEKIAENKSEVVIKLKDVFFSYGKEDLIKNLSLEIKKGDFYAMVGANGVGKSTTLNLICDIYKPIMGKVTVKSKKIAKLSQNPSELFTQATVLEDLKEVCSDDIKIQNMLDFVDMSGFKNSHPFDLSGGEKQRIALAKILLLEPEILLLDEPTKGIDNFFKEKLAKILKELNEKGTTILIVSHDIEFCAKYVKKCGMFFDGNIISEDNTREFFAGNSFYTTASNKMTNKLFENAITAEDVIYLCKKNLA